MFILLALATSTVIGEYRTRPACEAVIRQIYTQKADPYNLMESDTLKRIVDLQMRFSAPKEYMCVKR